MDEILATLEIPAIGLTILFVSAVMEYLFPPYPGDTIMVGGFLLAARGDASLPLTFLVALAGSILGAQLAYGIGVRFGDSYFLLRRSSRAPERFGRQPYSFPRFGARVGGAGGGVGLGRGMKMTPGPGPTKPNALAAAHFPPPGRRAPAVASPVGRCGWR